MSIKTPYEKEERVSATPEKRLPRFVRVQVIFASIQTAIVLVTCMVAVYIGLQQQAIHQQLLDASRDTIQLHREVLERTEVATIVLDTVHCAKTPLTLATEVHPVFRNSGRTVAKEVTLTWYLTLRGVPLGPKPVDPPPSKTFIPIGGNIVGDALAVSTALNKDSLALVNAGKMHLTVLGTLEFSDVFDHKHAVDFSAVYVPNTACDFRLISVVDQRIP
jgi:hypothetical protein